MEQSYIIKNLRSPEKRRVRHALKFLSKNVGRVEFAEELFSDIVNKLNHDDWSIRSVALSSITRFSIMNRKYLDASIDALKKAMEDDHPNVRSNALYNYLNLLNIYMDNIAELAREFIDKGLNDENNDVKAASLTVLEFTLRNKLLDIGDYLPQIFELLRETENPKIIENAFKILSSNIDLLVDESTLVLKDIIFNFMHASMPEIRRMALEMLLELYKADKINEQDFRDQLIKRLRDETDVVKYSAIEVVEKITEKDIKSVDFYIGIVVNEILLRTKNRNLKLKILDFLEKKIEKIPQNIVYKYDIPRALDIIEKSTVPKNNDYRKIKMLARSILESKLGYDLEKRMKKFNKK